MPRLNQDEIVTLHTLKSKKQTNRAIARTLGVSEGTVRYHVRKQKEKRPDGRKKGHLAEEMKEPIEEWMKVAEKENREANLRDLHDWLVSEHGYAHSYKSVYRYVRAIYPPPKRRPYRRVELPAGAQAQVDWCERKILVGGVSRTLYGFWMVLSHSRADALIWMESMDQLHWQQAHNQAFVRLGGVTASIRIDNLKTGMSQAGPRGKVNPEYARYARSAGFHVDACAVRHPEAKGKVESRVAKLPRAQELMTRTFRNLEELQAWTDTSIRESWEQRTCPATGESVMNAWKREQPLLGSAENLPKPFDIVTTRKVGKDCMLSFQGRSYSVPFAYAWSHVEVRGGADHLEIWSSGECIARHSRTGESLLVIQPEHFEGEATPTHLRPLPLGKVAETILECAEAEVELRSVAYYEALMERCG